MTVTPPSGEAAPASPSGEAAPASPSGEAAPASPSGEAAPASPSGEAAPASAEIGAAVIGAAVIGAAEKSAWDPLRAPAFRNLWLASLVTNMGALIHGVGAAWLMTSLSPSPLMVALVQTATNLPTFLLALPAGALADVVDRRRLLLVTQSWMLLSALGLGIMAYMGLATPLVLLALTFSLGCGAALNGPAWQAIVPELVPRAQLAAAVTVNSVGFNLARAVGPAIGGIVVAQAGVSATFLLNAASFIVVLAVLVAWRRVPARHVLPTERVAGAMRSGVNYLRHAPLLRRVLTRTAAFMVFASALWALLPLLARQGLGLDVQGYGLLLGCLGVGALAGAAMLPWLRANTTLDQRIVGATLAYAAGSALAAAAPHVALAGLGLVLAGSAWLVNMSGFNSSVQGIAPDWVRGRALSIYLLIVFGSLAAGSALWGAVAEGLGLGPALWIPAAGMLGSLLLHRRMPLARLAELDLSASHHWPEPVVTHVPEPEEGPVFVTVEYDVDPALESLFREAMAPVRRARMRSGAVRWNLLGDLTVPGRYVETFMVESWLAHLRQHERLTRTDEAVEARARTYHRGAEAPRMNHLLSMPVSAHGVSPLLTEGNKGTMMTEGNKGTLIAPLAPVPPVPMPAPEGVPPLVPRATPE